MKVRLVIEEKHVHHVTIEVPERWQHLGTADIRAALNFDHDGMNYDETFDLVNAIDGAVNDKISDTTLWDVAERHYVSTEAV